MSTSSAIRLRNSMDASKRYHSLDLLKFILSILIVFHHFQQDIAVSFRYINFFDGIFNFAYCVELFFMISGFLSMNRKEKIENSSFRDFLFGKIRRFFPMCSLSILFMLVLEFVYFMISGSWYHGLKPDLYKVFNSFLMTFSGGSILAGRGINNPLWFLSVLLKCLIILWLIVKICKKHKIDIIYPSVVMVSIGISVISYELDLPFLNEEAARGYAAFFLGIILYKLYHNVDHDRFSFLSFGILAVCLVLGVIDHATFYHYEWGTYTLVVLPCVLFTALHFEKYLKPGFADTLGKVSFEIYVWHASFIYLLEIIFLLVPGMRESAEPHLLMALFTLAVLVFSFAMYRFVEKKAEQCFLKMIDFFKAKNGGAE